MSTKMCPSSTDAETANIKTTSSPTTLLLANTSLNPLFPLEHPYCLV